MTDFSDKYRKALEYQELSPDFKERTAKLMTELRDADAPVPKTADENDSPISPVIISEGSSAKSDRTKFIKLISTAAAAAACLTVAFALNKAGVLDSNSEVSLAAADSISTEVTDLIESEEAEEGTADAEYDIAMYDVIPDEAIDEMPEETEPTTEAEPPAETEAAVTAPLSEYSAPVTIAFTSASAEADVTEALKNEAPAADESNDNKVEAVEEDYPLETVLILEPFSEDSGEEAEIPAEADGSYDDDISDEEAITDNGDVPSSARSASFSPKTAVSEFPAQNATAVITPSFEDIDPENGNVVTYESKQIRSVSKLIELNKELYDFSDSEASYSSEAPADSRYIIDYTDKQGNALRIYMGSRYICFAKDGYYYTFDLTEEEYNKLDGTLFGLIS